ncbi:helix-turn-helix domain-containing protein [Leptospira sp. 96542]|nr:helix-turn-helix domain-containing protein [Leptospira sp. 96542]
MSDPRHPYIRLMTDIIDSGVWAELSHAAKTLYPVLLKFSDYSFKPVWPSTETLLRLTGFKTKKSIVIAKKELTKAGLLFQIPGGGRTSTRYHFSFHYQGSKITPLGDPSIPWRGAETDTSGDSRISQPGGRDGTPNHINITISNTNNVPTPELEGKKEGKNTNLDTLVDLFGSEIAMEAYQKALALRMESDFAYLKGVCKELIASAKQTEVRPNSKQFYPEPSIGMPHPASWLGFLNWARKELTPRTCEQLETIKIQLDGNVVVIETSVQGYLKQIIQMYFTERVKPSLVVVFASVEEGSRISEIR